MCVWVLNPASIHAEDLPVKPANSDSATVPDVVLTRIGSLEAKFFGELHTGDAPERRMDRLEKFVYGAATGGTVMDRLKNIESGMSQKNPDGTAAKPLPTSIDVPIIPPAGVPVPLPPVPDVPPEEAKRGSDSSKVALKPVEGPLRLSLTKFRDVQQPKRLVQELTEAIESDPTNNAELFFQRAKAFLELEDYGHALSDLTDAIQKEPMKSDYYLARACVLNKLGKPVLARKDLSRARFVNPTLPEEIQFDKDAGGE